MSIGKSLHHPTRWVFLQLSAEALTVLPLSVIISAVIIMKKRLVIFDCFGVIFGEIAPRFFGNHFEKEEALVLKEKYFRGVDLGTTTLDQVFDAFESELGLNRAECVKEWYSLIRLNEAMVPLIKKAKETADVALLSNAPLGFVEKIFDEHSLTELFDRMFISCNLGLAKPDPEIYKYAVSQMGREYDEIFMIDDNEGNLTPLPALGITPVHFKGPESLDVLWESGDE